MHIVQMANFHSPTSGGIKVALDRLAHHYVAAGHKVTQIFPGPSTDLEFSEPLAVLRVRGPQLPGLGGYRIVLNRKTLRDLVQRLQPDVLELSDRTTMLTVADTARSLGVPTVLISHERLEAVLAHVLPSDRLIRSAVRRYNQRVMTKVDAVVCASAFAAEEYSGLEGAPIVRIALGVDLDQFSPNARPDVHLSDCGTGLRLVSVTRHSPEKDPHLPIAVVAELVARGRSVTLDMIGSGALTADLQRLATGLPVVFHGHVSDRAHVATLLASADVAIAPGPNETFGLAALEALACGTPVVVPTHGALAEMVAGGQIGASAASTPRAMADAVESLHRSSRDGEQRQACRDYAERFPWSVTAGHFMALFESLRSGSMEAA